MKCLTLAAAALMMSFSPLLVWAQDQPAEPESPAAPAAQGDARGGGGGGSVEPTQPPPIEEATQAAQDAAAAEAEAKLANEMNVTKTTIVTGLVNPTSVAVQPGTGHIFVSDSGAHRIVQFDPANPGELKEVVTGFNNDVYGKGPMYDIGPLGLLFINQNTLVVGGGGDKDGEEKVFVFTLPEDGAAQTADQATATAGPIAAGEQSQNGEGNFFALAATATSLFVTSNGDDTKGWILKATIADGKPTDLRTFIATKEAVQVDAPVAIAINPNLNGGHLVVGQMGEITVPNDSLLTFYHPDTGEMMLNLTTSLYDIAGLAYAPSDDVRRLYAVDFAWMAPEQGGVFRLEKTLDNSGAQGVKAVRVATLERPSALAFGADGAMYVPVFGASDDETQKTGGVVKITGNF